jgi:Ser-tRNA(Ala) deacylase AlaX
MKNKQTIEIGDKIFTSDEIGQLIELVTELVDANNELNARIIAMNAKLENEEKKVVNLSQRLAQMSLMFTNKTYEG